MNRWLTGARPRTLPAAVVPVAVGTAAAVGVDGSDGIVWWRVVAALVVSLALQIGVNYANDYSDGVRGTDDVRVGPTRLVASGLASPSSVKKAALASFGVAAVAGLAIALDTSLWLLVVGAAAIAAGWFYTGGPKPYGYLGLGEIFVFVFFGLVATAGSTYAAIAEVTGLSIVMGVRGRIAGLRTAGDQQPARHPDRSRGRQAHARRPARRSAHPVVLRDARDRRIRAHRGRRRLAGAGAARVPVDPARRRPVHGRFSAAGPARP